MDTNVIKTVATVVTVLIAALSALAGTGVLSPAATGIVGGVLAVLNALGGYLANRTVKARLAAAKAAR